MDCGISRNFLFQLACFFGPEYFGQVLPADQEEDVLCRSGTVPALTEEEAAAYASNVNEAESTMEQLKLVYENVYANIYYTYAMCGQTVEHLTLLDVEEALPVPVLLRYCRTWRTEADAVASILDLLQDIKIVEQVTAAGEKRYRSDCYERLVHQCQNDTLWAPRERMSFRDVLEQNCVATDFLTSRINGLEAPDARPRKDNASLNPERAFWNNDYQVPSDQKLNGLLAVLSERDVADDFLMSRLLARTRVTDASDVYFVYVPSYTSRSHVTGNVHRLSFCADHSAIRTPRLRQIRYASLISLARTVFPSRSPHFPLVMRLRVSFASAQVHWTRPFRHIRVGLSAPFSIELVPRGRGPCGGVRLYQLGQFLMDSANFRQVNTALLQMILVELFVQKLVTEDLARQPPHVQGFVRAYETQKLTFFQKIQLFGPSKNDVHRIEENSQYNISSQVCFNALAVVYGAAALDQRAAVPEDVFHTLELNQFYVDHATYVPYFASYLTYCARKYKLLLQNYSVSNSDPAQMVREIDELLDYIALVEPVKKGLCLPRREVFGLVQAFLRRHYPTMFALASLRSESPLESDRLQLLRVSCPQEAKPSSQSYEFQKLEEHSVQPTHAYDEVRYDSVCKLQAELSYLVGLQLVFDRYSFVKLSNLVVMSEQVFRRAYRSSTAQRIKDPFHPEQTVVSSIQALQIVNRVIRMNEIRGGDAENLAQRSDMSSSSSNESS